MIIVTGATGRLGSLAVDDLLGRVPAAEIAVLARDPERAAGLAEWGVEVRRGDYDDPASLRAAFDGADVLLFVSSPDITSGRRPEQHANVVDAAVAAGVGRVVYTSAIGAQDGQGFLADHTTTEALLAASGLPHTLLRNTFYLEALVNPGLRAVVEQGELQGADEGRAVNFATIADLAQAASAAVTEPGQAGAVHELRGELWTLPELAATLAEVSGRPVRYRPALAEDLGPAAFVHSLIASGLFAEPADDLEKLIGRPPTSLRDAVEKVLKD